MQSDVDLGNVQIALIHKDIEQIKSDITMLVDKHDELFICLKGDAKSLGFIGKYCLLKQSVDKITKCMWAILAFALGIFGWLIKKEL